MYGVWCVFSSSESNTQPDLPTDLEEAEPFTDEDFNGGITPKIVEGDLIVDDALLKMTRQEPSPSDYEKGESGRSRRAAGTTFRLWPNGIIPYKFHDSFRNCTYLLGPSRSLRGISACTKTLSVSLQIF